MLRLGSDGDCPGDCPFHGSVCAGGSCDADEIALALGGAESGGIGGVGDSNLNSGVTGALLGPPPAPPTENEAEPPCHEPVRAGDRGESEGSRSRGLRVRPQS